MSCLFISFHLISGGSIPEAEGWATVCRTNYIIVEYIFFPSVLIAFSSPSLLFVFKTSVIPNRRLRCYGITPWRLALNPKYYPASALVRIETAYTVQSLDVWEVHLELEQTIVRPFNIAGEPQQRNYFVRPVKHIEYDIKDRLSPISRGEPRNFRDIDRYRRTNE